MTSGNVQGSGSKEDPKDLIIDYTALSPSDKAISKVVERRFSMNNPASPETTIEAKVITPEIQKKPSSTFDLNTFMSNYEGQDNFLQAFNNLMKAIDKNTEGALGDFKIMIEYLATNKPLAQDLKAQTRAKRIKLFQDSNFKEKLIAIAQKDPGFVASIKSASINIGQKYSEEFNKALNGILQPSSTSSNKDKKALSKEVPQASDELSNEATVEEPKKDEEALSKEIPEPSSRSSNEATVEEPKIDEKALSKEITEKFASRIDKVSFDSYFETSCQSFKGELPEEIKKIQEELDKEKDPSYVIENAKKYDSEKLRDSLYIYATEKMLEDPSADRHSFITNLKQKYRELHIPASINSKPTKSELVRRNTTDGNIKKSENKPKRSLSIDTSPQILGDQSVKEISDKAFQRCNSIIYNKTINELDFLDENITPPLLEEQKKHLNRLFENPEIMREILYEKNLQTGEETLLEGNLDLLYKATQDEPQSLEKAILLLGSLEKIFDCTVFLFQQQLDPKEAMHRFFHSHLEAINTQICEHIKNQTLFSSLDIIRIKNMITLSGYQDEYIGSEKGHETQLQASKGLCAEIKTNIEKALGQPIAKSDDNSLNTGSTDSDTDSEKSTPRQDLPDFNNQLESINAAFYKHEKGKGFFDERKSSF